MSTRPTASRLVDAGKANDRPAVAGSERSSTLDRRTVLRQSAALAIGLFAAPMVSRGQCRLCAERGIEVPTRVVDLVAKTSCIDMLGLLTLDWARLFQWQRDPKSFTADDYSGLRAASIDIFHPAVEASHRDAYRSVGVWLRGWNNLLGDHTCRFARIDSTRDLETVPASGRIGLLIGFQSSDHFRDVDDVADFFARGQRVSQLTYNEQSLLGSGCLAYPDRGLSRQGARIVEEMNRVGMAVDVSHCSERTSLDAIEASSKPVLITHSNCKALVPGQPRCKSDRVLERMAAKGGVIGLTLVRPFVRNRWTPNLDDVLDHFDHVARLVGVEHVGLGSDVDLSGRDPATGRPNRLYEIRGLDPALRVFQIADGLLRRGYNESDVALMLGGNFRRVLTQVLPPPRQASNDREMRRDPFCAPPVDDAPDA